MNIEEMTDVQRYEMCRNFGAQVIEARRKFIGLLPAVNRRRLYDKKGFSSIFHFAAVLAGVSEEQVRRALNIEKRLESFPIVKEQLVSGEISVSKISKAIAMLTTENEKEVAAQLKTLSHTAFETLARDVRANTQLQQNIEIVNEPPLSVEVKKKLNELAHKGIDINQIILETLQKREKEIAQEKEELAQKAEQKLIKQITEEKPVTRMAPAATKKLLKKEFGSKCAIATCKNKAEVIHHTNRFSISHDHNPYYLAPLCKAHHQIAHSVDTHVNQARLTSTLKTFKTVPYMVQ